jgi:hypothetical protein
MQHRAVPAGKYMCTLIKNRESGAAVEMLVEVAAGRCRESRIRFIASGADKAARATAMNPGDRLMVVLRYKRGDGHANQPLVTNFYAAGQPTVVTVMGGMPSGDGGEPTIWPISHYSIRSLDDEQGLLRMVPAHAALTPYPVFPEELGDAIRSELHMAEVECDDIIGGEGGADDAYWIDRTLERVAQDHPLCLLKIGDRKTEPAQFEAVFARFCRGEAGSDADQPVLVSAYQYGEDVAAHVRAREGVDRDYRCPVWARWLHAVFRADGDPDAALARCRLFVSAVRRLGACRHQVLVFTLGAGDLEVMFPAAMARCLPRPGFEYVTGYLCEMIADWSPCCSREVQNSTYSSCWTPSVSQPLDTGLYMPLAAVQMPNARVRDSDRYKVRIGLDELFSLDAGAIASLADSPRPFNPPPWRAAAYGMLIAIWQHAVAVAVCRSQSIDQITLANRWVYPRTFDFMCFGVDAEEAGERLFAAAMNMLDFGCPFALLEALLAPAALMSGMPSTKVKKTLANAIHASRRARPLPIEVLHVPSEDEHGWDPTGMESDP